MSWTAYEGDAYLDFEAVADWCRRTAAAFPERVALTEVGESRQGRPMLLLTLGRIDGGEGQRPAFWLDGGAGAGATARWRGRCDSGGRAGRAAVRCPTVRRLSTGRGPR